MVLKFNGTPVFRGTKADCEKFISDNYSERAARFCRIISEEECREAAESKLLIAAAANHTRSRSFSADGDVEYYD